MTNNRFVFSILIVLIILFIDQLTKSWGLTLQTLHYNNGFIMGYFSNLPNAYRVVALSAFAGLIFSIYVPLIYIIPLKGRSLILGISILVGGMLGNVFDKILYGKTIDFIPLVLGNFRAYFNIADVFLWIGAGVIVWALYRKDTQIWYPDSTRGRYLINSKEQFKVGFQYLALVFCCSFALGIFSYSFFNMFISPLGPRGEQIMVTFFITYLAVTLLFCSLAFFIGVIFSHRSVGPIYAFELFVNEIIGGKDRKLKLRASDNYKQLEEVAERIREFLKEKNS